MDRVDVFENLFESFPHFGKIVLSMFSVKKVIIFYLNVISKKR